MEGTAKSTSGVTAGTTSGMNGKPRFLLLYGSQTGQSQAVAEEIADKCGDYSFQADLHCLSTTDKAVGIFTPRRCTFQWIYQVDMSNSTV